MNNELTDNEVNKIIAEFMGLKNIDLKKDPNRAIKEFIGRCDYLLYTESLDALVPVWEKLASKSRSLDTLRILTSEKSFDFILWSGNFWNGKIKNHTEKETIQQAAAHATAKAILELNEVNNAKL